MSAAVEWGLPDWCDPHSYGATSLWSDHRWRWEFTRRREDYREDFAAAVPRTLAEGDMRRFGPGVVPPTCANEPGFTALCPHALERYGLPDLPNPRFSEQLEEVIDFGARPDRFLVVGRRDLLDLDAPPGSAAAVFDLGAPLGAQLARVARLLQQEQARSQGERPPDRRTTSRLWLRYLRVLDARETGASLARIAAVVLAGENIAANQQEASSNWRAARRLMFNWPA